MPSARDSQTSRNRLRRSFREANTPAAASRRCRDRTYAPGRVRAGAETLKDCGRGIRRRRRAERESEERRDPRHRSGVHRLRSQPRRSAGAGRGEGPGQAAARDWPAGTCRRDRSRPRRPCRRSFPPGAARRRMVRVRSGAPAEPHGAHTGNRRPRRRPSPARRCAGIRQSRRGTDSRTRCTGRKNGPQDDVFETCRACLPPATVDLIEHAHQFRKPPVLRKRQPSYHAVPSRHFKARPGNVSPGQWLFPRRICRLPKDTGNGPSGAHSRTGNAWETTLRSASATRR